MKKTITFKKLMMLINGDLKRQTGKENGSFLYRFIVCMFNAPWYRCTYYYRICKYFDQFKITKYTINVLFKLIKSFHNHRWNIYIPLSMDIGKGFRIEHPGGIFLSPSTQVGSNVTLSNNVSFGYIARGNYEGTPISIGDRCYFSPGSKVLGSVTIGSGVVVGANSVVIKDLPDNAAAMGIPARAIPVEGSQGYINLIV